MMTKLQKVNATILCIIIIVLGISGYHLYNVYIQNQQEQIRKENFLKHKHMWKTIRIAQRNPSAHNLANITFHRPWKRCILYLKNNRSTLSPSSWNYDHIDFSHQDIFGRTSYPATAYLEQKNATGDALRIPQKVLPVGWHQKYYHHEFILNRGHLIAYSLSKDINFNGIMDNNKVVGNQDDPNNLFTETSYCNQKLQYSFETLLRIALEHNKHIIYQVQPIFRGNELMPRGVHLQAVSTDKKFHFNVYCFNIQPGIKFNYQTGTSTIAKKEHIIKPKFLIRHSTHLDNHDKYMVLQRKIMHLYKKRKITYKQAKIDESKILGKYMINNIPNSNNAYQD